MGRLSKQDAVIMQRLRVVDPNLDQCLPAADYEAIVNKVGAVSTTSRTYIGRLDSLHTSFQFFNNVSGVQQMANLQSAVDKSALIQQYVTQRQQAISQYLSRYSRLPDGVGKMLNGYKTSAYYYKQQMADLKAAISDPVKLEKDAYSRLSKLPAYQAFFAKHSLLASMFSIPVGYGDSTALAGLQTKDAVQQQLQGKVGHGGNAALTGQMDQAYGNLKILQDNVAKYGIAGQTLDMPSTEPNSQATKRFANRLTYGCNLQVTKYSSYLPATGVLGGQLGYRLDDKKTVGVGLAYNLGVGQDVGHIHFSSQGIGLRSYAEICIKRSWYATGGYELNDLSAFHSIGQLRQYSAWQSSALIGIEKKYRFSSKVQGSLQLLFDALYRQEMPAGQAIRFRTGYSFK